MPIETPKHTISTNPRLNGSEFVLCQNIAFRLSSVDGFSHQQHEDDIAITTINFKGYTQCVVDSERRLFDFLLRQLEPKDTAVS